MKRMIALTLALCLFAPVGKAEAEEPPPALVKAIAQQESGLNPLRGNRIPRPRGKRRNGLFLRPSQLESPLTWARCR